MPLVLHDNGRTHAMRVTGQRGVARSSLALMRGSDMFCFMAALSPMRPAIDRN